MKGLQLNRLNNKSRNAFVKMLESGLFAADSLMGTQKSNRALAKAAEGLRAGSQGLVKTKKTRLVEVGRLFSALAHWLDWGLRPGHLSSSVLRRAHQTWLSVSLNQANWLLQAALLGNPKVLHKAVQYWQMSYSLVAAPKHLKGQAGQHLRADHKRISRVLHALGSLAVAECLGASMEWKDYLKLVQVSPKVKPVRLQEGPLTKSTSQLAMLEQRLKGGRTQALVYKTDWKAKLKRERRGIKVWRKVSPRLAPKIVGYRKQGKKAGILLERLQGDTFESVFRGGTGEKFSEALAALCETLLDNWVRTAKPAEASSGFMDQLKARLAAVQARHPKLKGLDKGGRNGGRRDSGYAQLEELIREVAQSEVGLKSPVSVLMHGDMNVDNILISDGGDQVVFVDLHRSAYSDYLQDASVLMVSCLRLAPQEPHSRKQLAKRVRKVVKKVLAVCKEFAQMHQDPHWEGRLRIALARSLITSIRFINDQPFAQNLFDRGLSLLQEAAKPSKQAVQINYEKVFDVEF